MNLANALTVGRIVVAPLVALLPFAPSWELRLAGFVLFIVAAVSDYYDGMIARTRNLVTNLGKLLDPLADKLLLVCTFVPMYLMQRSIGEAPWWIRTMRGEPLLDEIRRGGEFPFVLPGGLLATFPLWVLVVILGRELFMTIFRQLAARRGVIIAAIGPAKWKTGMQLVWQGSAYFWFFAATLAATRGWTGEPLWQAFASFNGIVGLATMSAAVLLTVYSLWLYLRRYGGLLKAITAGRG